jgi:hypothetical protein
MKQKWNIDELEEHFALLLPEIEWLGDNADHNHLGKATQLKVFQFEGRFPEEEADVTVLVREHITQ